MFYCRCCTHKKHVLKNVHKTQILLDVADLEIIKCDAWLLSTALGSRRVVYMYTQY